MCIRSLTDERVFAMQGVDDPGSWYGNDETFIGLPHCL